MIYPQVSSISSNEDITRPVCSGFYLILDYGLVVIGWRYMKSNPQTPQLAAYPLRCFVILKVHQITKKIEIWEYVYMSDNQNDSKEK